MLTGRRRRFVAEYLIDLNGSAAAKRAGYSAKTARTIANELLTIPDIQAAITAEQQARASRTQINADRVLLELAAIGFSDAMRHYAFDGQNLVVVDGAPPSASRAVASIKRKVRVIPQKEGDPIEIVETEYKLWDKNSALEKLGKHLGMWKDEGDPGARPLLLVGSIEELRAIAGGAK